MIRLEIKEQQTNDKRMGDGNIGEIKEQQANDKRMDDGSIGWRFVVCV